MDPTAILTEILGKNATGGGLLDGLLKGGRGRAPQPKPAPRTAPKPASAPKPAPPSGGGGLDSILGDLFGGGARKAPQPPASNAPAPGGGGDILAELDRAARRRGVDLGKGSGGGLGDVFRMPEPEPEPPPPPKHVQDQATLLIRAMCNAAKVDGKIDEAEQEAILGRLGDVGREELDFVRKEINSPLDLDAYVRTVPADLAPQVYAFSALAVNVDTLREAAYLGRLAQALGLDNETCNEIHRKVGAAPLYA